LTISFIVSGKDESRFLLWCLSKVTCFFKCSRHALNLQRSYRSARGRNSGRWGVVSNQGVNTSTGSWPNQELWICVSKLFA
jgi:hypothetical protein